MSHTYISNALKSAIPAECAHFLQFYNDEKFLKISVSAFVEVGLRSGEGVIIIATEEHQKAISAQLLSSGIDVRAAKRRGQLTILDANETLSTFMVNGLPHRELFFEVVGNLVDKTLMNYPVLRAYGEMVNLLWHRGNVDATISLEELWNKLQSLRTFSLLCGYTVGSLDEVVQNGFKFRDVCRTHTHIVPHDTHATFRHDDAQLRLISELKQRTMALQIEVAQRRTMEVELRQAKEAADSANKIKSEFLANMSHEIRTPLGAIVGFTELMQTEDQTESDRRECLMTINRNGQHLLEIINDILDLSKVEAGKLEIDYQKFSLSDFINEIRLLEKPQARAKGLELEFVLEGTVPRTIVSDRTRLRQIMVNLIGNSIKFTDRGAIKVFLKYLNHNKKQSGKLEVRVQDTGRGMRKDQIVRLFRPFSQGDNSTTRKYGGTGLGLALSRKLSQALGGDITIESSSPGVGSTFKVTFDVGDGDNVEFVAELKDSTEIVSRSGKLSADKVEVLAGIRVLLVEDSLDNQVLVGRMLKIAGAELDFANNGEEGVRMALEGQYHVVLMDVQMPVLDGFAATSQLREAGYSRPIIALTAHAMIEERQRCLEAGYVDHLAKPISRSQMIETVFKYSGH